MGEGRERKKRGFFSIGVKIKDPLAKELRTRDKKKKQLFFSGVLFMKKNEYNKRSGGGLDFFKKNMLRVLLGLDVTGVVAVAGGEKSRSACILRERKHRGQNWKG